MSTEVPCAVCTAPGTLRCSRCRSIRFCGPEHQALLWSSHKLLCKPNAPLVFRGRRLEDSELRAWGDTPFTEDRIHKAARDHPGFIPAALREEMNLLAPVEQESMFLAILGVNACHPFAPYPAHAYASLILSDYVPADSTSSPFTLVHHTVITPNPVGIEATERKVISSTKALDPDTRNAFELQALVLCTLLEKEAEEELVELAVQRISDIVGGDKRLIEKVRSVIKTVRTQRAVWRKIWR